MVEEQRESPEEITQEGQQQCVFCHIATGRVASKKVYEDDKVTAVLDINPASPGHVLLIPKEHYVVMPQIPEDVLQHLGMVAKGISHAQLRALKAQGTNLFVANGIAAGQRAQHFMLHVIPRMEGDNLGLGMPERAMSAAETAKLRQILRKALTKTLGLKIEEEPEAHAEEQVPHEEPKTPKKAKEAEKKPSKSTNLDEIAKLFTGGK